MVGIGAMVGICDLILDTCDLILDTCDLNLDTCDLILDTIANRPIANCPIANRPIVAGCAENIAVFLADFKSAVRRLRWRPGAFRARI